MASPIRPTLLAHALLAFIFCVASHCRADWQVLTAGDQRQARPPKKISNATPIKPGDRWPADNKFRWLIGELEIPALIGKESAAGKSVGLQLSVGDGGEVWIDGELQCRFDNDHPALVVIATNAKTGATVRVDIQVYGKVQGGDKWFRMDNVFTGALKKDKATGELTNDWRDLDKRVDFIRAIGADPILCASYMPQVLDAVPNNERQSAPKDYAAWEELCYQAAKHCLDRDRRVPFWEVWNEVNTGWLKPGPEDTGSDAFRNLYTQALGREDTNTTTVRRFEAYCKLYRATARGILRADPIAKIGGPALASGPMENSKDCGHCSHGAGFARGLMLWCAQEKLPLDFVSWHEYFQPPEKIAKEAAMFRTYLEEFPTLQHSVSSFMITEWNEAWWPDRPQDHEVGAAWCANSITRAFIPAHIDRPCFFYVKQGGMNFRGDYSLLMKDNIPKASYNVAKIFNGLTGRWISISGTDGDVSAVSAWDAERRRLSVVLVNFRDRYALRRPVRLGVASLPAELRNGIWQTWTVDGTHSNVWHDQGKAELTRTQTGTVNGNEFTWDNVLQPNSVTLLELKPE